MKSCRSSIFWLARAVMCMAVCPASVTLASYSIQGTVSGYAGEHPVTVTCTFTFPQATAFGSWENAFGTIKYRKILQDDGSQEALVKVGAAISDGSINSITIGAHGRDAHGSNLMVSVNSDNEVRMRLNPVVRGEGNVLYHNLFVWADVSVNVDGQTAIFSIPSPETFQVFLRNYLQIEYFDYFLTVSRLTANVKEGQTYNNADSYAGKGAAGVSVIPSGSKFSFMPAKCTTDESGRAKFRILAATTDFGFGVTPQLTSDFITIDAGGLHDLVKVEIPFCIVASVSGYVGIYNEVGGGYVRLSGQERVPPNSRIRVGDGSPSTPPHAVGLLMCNGMKGDLECTESTKFGIIDVGPLGAELHDVGMYMMLDGVGKDIQENPRPYITVTVTWLAPMYLTGGASQYGWLAKKGVDQLVNYVLTKVINGPNAQSILSAGSDNPRIQSLESGQTDPVYVKHCVNSDGTDTLVMRSGAGQIIEGSHVTLMARDASVVIPENTPTVGIPGYEPPPDYGAGVTVAVTPTNACVVTNCMQAVSVDWTPESTFFPVLPDTLVARLNGVLVSTEMSIADTGATWAVPARLAMRNGTNRFACLVRTSGGGVGRAIADWVVEAKPEAPAWLTADAGRSNILLRWAPVSSPSPGSYSILRASASNGPYSVIGETPDRSTAWSQAPETEGTWWYKIAHVDNSVTGAVSQSCSATLWPSAPLPVPSEETGVTAQVIDNGIQVLIPGVATNALAWRLERSVGVSNAYQCVGSTQELLCAGLFMDTNVVAGQSYWYRVVPLGRDFVAGPTTTVGSVMFTDVTPPPPEGVTADLRDGIRTVRIEWNPMNIPDLRGYKIYRRVAGSPTRTCLTPVPVGSAFFDDQLPTLDIQYYEWEVTAVDLANHESTYSAPFLLGVAPDRRPGSFSIWYNPVDRQQVYETETNFTLKVTRSYGRTGFATVSYTVDYRYTTATPYSDFTPIQGTLTFAEGETEKILTIPVMDDALAEDDETITITLYGAGNGATVGAVGSSSVTMNLLDNENLPNAVLHGMAYLKNTTAAVINDGNPLPAIVVCRSQGTSGVVSVQYSMTADTAQPGVDYVAVTGTITWASGDSANKTQTVQIVNDDENDAGKQFKFNIGHPRGGLTLGGNQTTTIRFNSDNDQTAYQKWLNLYFTPAEQLQPGMAGREDDPDHDGYVNLVEYAQYMNPRGLGSLTNQVVAFRSDWEPGEKVMCWQFRVRKNDLAHVLVFPETSFDLKTWYPAFAVQVADETQFVIMEMKLWGSSIQFARFSVGWQD